MDKKSLFQHSHIPILFTVSIGTFLFPDLNRLCFSIMDFRTNARILPGKVDGIIIQSGRHHQTKWRHHQTKWTTSSDEEDTCFFLVYTLQPIEYNGWYSFSSTQHCSTSSSVDGTDFKTPNIAANRVQCLELIS